MDSDLAYYNHIAMQVPESGIDFHIIRKNVIDFNFVVKTIMSKSLDTNKCVTRAYLTNSNRGLSTIVIYARQPQVFTRRIFFRLIVLNLPLLKPFSTDSVHRQLFCQLEEVHATSPSNNNLPRSQLENLFKCCL